MLAGLTFINLQYHENRHTKLVIIFKIKKNVYFFIVIILGSFFLSEQDAIKIIPFKIIHTHKSFTYVLNKI